MFQSKFSQTILALVVGALFLVPALTFARVGVGIGSGKIQMDQALHAGGIYVLPPLPIINTGDEPSDYSASVEYLQGTPELRPAKEWFTFEPQTFHLDPGAVRIVNATLTLPTNVEPGDYFAYLEGHPFVKSVAGQTSIGVAAAAKLYFSVAPSNIFQAVYYRLASLSVRFYPWDVIVLGVVALTLLLRFIGKRFKFEIAKK